MGRVAGLILLGAMVGVGAMLAYQALQRGGAGGGGDEASPRTRPAAVSLEVRGARVGVGGGTTRPAAGSQGAKGRRVGPTDLLQRARRAGSEREQLALYRRLLKVYPASGEAEIARREALEVRRALADKYRAAGDLFNLRNVLSEMLWQGLSEEEEARIKREIVALNQVIIFSRRPSPDAVIYTIRPRDTLAKIANRYKVTPELIARINGIKNPDRIRFGDAIKVVRGPFDILVELSKFRLTVLLRGRFVKEYPIGIGKDQTTPVGRFVVKDKLINPMWFGPDGEVMTADDPQNPLGERWIGITGTSGRGYGIHGTIEPESIGTACSRGCIRMLEEDVEEVFDFVVPKHSRVTIVE